MANNKDFDFIKMFYDIRQLCLTEEHCGKCKDENCLVGYARICIGKAKQKDTDTLIGAHRDIPTYDVNGGLYDREDTMNAIAHTLQQCRSCKDSHTPDCLVNIIRNCYEVILLGNERPYTGSTLMYLAALQEENPEVAAIIAEAYNSHTNPMEESF